jgi:hypothetical protein
MAQLTTDKSTDNYCIADDFCKEFSEEIKKHPILPNDGKRHRLQASRVRKNIII